MSIKNYSNRRLRLKRKIRGKISGTAEVPRLTVFRSNKQIYVQIVDDRIGSTLAAASSKDFTDKVKKTEMSVLVGKKIAEVAKANGIEKVVFDRNGYLYHGRVKNIADGAREGGLIF